MEACAVGGIHKYVCFGCGALERIRWHDNSGEWLIKGRKGAAYLDVLGMWGVMEINGIHQKPNEAPMPKVWVGSESDPNSPR